MKRLVTSFIVAVFALAASAQTSLAGRVYSHPNIIEEELKNKSGEIEKKVDEGVREEIAKAEKKRGRALTVEEKAKIKREAEEAYETAKVVLQASKTAVTMVFKTEKEVEMQIKMQMDDEALKSAGIGWAKRKALKAALSLMPSTQKMQYTVRNNLVICTDGADKDTLTISSDGKFLNGKLDDKTKFKLTRTK